MVNATSDINLSSGDSKFKVFLGLPFSWIATTNNDALLLDIKNKLDQYGEILRLEVIQGELKEFKNHCASLIAVENR